VLQLDTGIPPFVSRRSIPADSLGPLCLAALLPQLPPFLVSRLLFLRELFICFGPSIGGLIAKLGLYRFLIHGMSHIPTFFPIELHLSPFFFALGNLVLL
jgi:hypothetical protein